MTILSSRVMGKTQNQRQSLWERIKDIFLNLPVFQKGYWKHPEIYDRSMVTGETMRYDGTDHLDLPDILLGAIREEKHLVLGLKSGHRLDITRAWSINKRWIRVQPHPMATRGENSPWGQGELIDVAVDSIEWMKDCTVQDIMKTNGGAERARSSYNNRGPNAYEYHGGYKSYRKGPRRYAEGGGE